MYTRDNRYCILWPHLESGEHVLIEWSGRKTAFDDDEPVDMWHYERDVAHLLALHLQKQSAGLNDGNAGDYQIADKEWREALSRLKIQAKEDEDPAEILWDTGLLPRSCMPAMATASCALPTQVDQAMAFFKEIWLFSEEDGHYYNLWKLLDGEVVALDLGTSEATRPLSEATFETLHVEQLLVQDPDTELYHPLLVTELSGDETIAFDATGQDGTNQRVGQGACVRWLDIKADNTATIFRLTIELVATVPTVVAEEAPSASATKPAVLADIVGAPLKYVLLLDQFDATVRKLSVYNSTLAIANQTFQEPHVASTIAIRDSAPGDRTVKLLSISDGVVTIDTAPTPYVTAPDFIRFKDMLTGELRYLRIVDHQTNLSAT